MPNYRVCFINEIPRNDKLYRCCQRSIVVTAAQSEEAAIEEAKRRFAELEGVPDWRIHAALIEAEPIAVEPPRPPRRLSRPRSPAGVRHKSRGAH
jgi:hypothetical protein